MHYHIIENEPCCASQQNWPAHVRFGSKADKATLRGYVRFTPKSGHRQLGPICQFSAKDVHVLSINATARWLHAVLSIRRQIICAKTTPIDA
jgi:hypothetical protein